MSRIYNFSAGPAVLPEEVLREAAQEMLDYKGSGMSVMEMSHRSKNYEAIIEKAEKDLRLLAKIPDNYTVLFLQGGASQQFAMVPMNLMHKGKADFLLTGVWAQKAEKEARLYGQTHVVCSGEKDNFSSIPSLDKLPLDPDADYVHICENNTIFGTAFSKLPDTGSVPLVADQSSCFLSKPLMVERYGLIYAGAQKNVGPAGVTIVIIRNDLIQKEVWPGTPTMLRYKTHADEKSLYNTPPCYGIYICGKVFEQLLRQGGLEAMQQKNEAKAKLLYDCIDASALYVGTAAKDSRSLMNVTFVMRDPELDAQFLAEASKAGLSGLKGHRSVGGLRASIYNAMPMEGVEALVKFMQKFELEHPVKA